MYRFFLLLALLSSPIFSQSFQSADKNSELKMPKNVILLIGDGMGLSEVSASFYYGDSISNFERFEVIGLIKTSSSAELITDSAAGATAFACGVKTYNGAIGVDPEGKEVPTLVEILSEQGYSTGVISTSSVVHATPASFYAHVIQRRMYDAIAEFIPKSELDFVAGGGSKFFIERNDQKNLYQELRENGFEVHTENLPKETSGKKQSIILAEDGMPKMINGRGDFLPKATHLGINHLSKNKNGFFLMIEGSQIDWGGHSNDTDYLIGEVLDFDETIGVALDFAAENGDTLVIVTADHETGGFTLGPDGNSYNAINPTFATDSHSATLIPVFAFGPGASQFNGIYENSEIFHKIMALIGQ